MASKPVLWGRGSSTNVQKVIWTAHELGIEAERRLVGGPFGGNRTADFLALNPNGTVPVWQDDAFVLWESHAIMRHLARQEGHMYGDTPEAIAKTDQWLDWYALVFWPPVRLLFLDIFQTDQVPDEGNGGTAALAAAHRNLSLIDGTPTDFFTLENARPNLAEVSLAIGINRMLGLGFGIALPQRIAEWHDTVRKRPGFLLATEDEPDMPGHRS
ncbi:MAG: glutathione S-transferase N-terminal domain-containing protein [Pseudomonadota bacterium]